MRRLLRPSAFIAALAIGTTVAAVGCTYVNPPALAIADTSTQDPYYSLSAKDLRKMADDKVKSATRTNDPTSVSTAAVAAVLTEEIVLKIQKHELDRRGLTITDTDKSKAEQDLASQSQSQSQSQSAAKPSPGEVEFAAGTTILRDLLVADSFEKFGQTKRDELAHTLYDNAVKNGAKLPGELCLHAIEIRAVEDATSASPPPTPEQLAAALAKATDAKRRLDAGEPFASVADEVSALKTDIPGGDLQCRGDDGSQGAFPVELVKLVADVPAVTISQPKLFGGSYILVRVDSRKEAHTPTYEEIKTQAEAQADKQLGSQLVSALRADLFARTVVTIDPQFGRWDPVGQQVTPPDGAATPTTPTTTAPPFDPRGLLGGDPTAGSDPTGSAGVSETDPRTTPSSTTSSPAEPSTTSSTAPTGGSTTTTRATGSSTTTSAAATASSTSTSSRPSTSTTAVGR